MSDGITDGTYQSKIPEINIKRTTDHKNVYADTAIYQVMTTFGTETIQIFESDNKERAQSFIDSIISNGYLKTLNPTLNIVYVNHSIIEDGYYTYSHIYENGQTINFTIYNTPLTYNVADVIQGWNGYVVQFSTDVSHWWYDNHAYAWSADGTDRFTNVYPNLNLLAGTSSTLKTASGKNWDTGAPDSIKANPTVLKNGQSYTYSAWIQDCDVDTRAVIYIYDSLGFHSYTGNVIAAGSSGLSTVTFNITGDATKCSPSVGFTEKQASYHNLKYSKLKLEPGSTDTPWMPSDSEVQPSDYPQFIGTQHTPIGYLHDAPKWYDWQPFTGTVAVENTHTEFAFSAKLWDTIEEIKAIAPINKRNIRNDNWKYQPNEQYPFIGGYES